MRQTVLAVALAVLVATPTAAVAQEDESLRCSGGFGMLTCSAGSQRIYVDIDRYCRPGY